MEIKGNTYYFTSAEKNKIKKLIDKKYGKNSSPIDYESTSGDNDIGLEAEIYKTTGEMLSGSTLERLVGLQCKENSGVRKSTIKTVIKYLDFQDSRQFIKHIEYLP